MPNLDKTGPNGNGPTGMKKGGCTGEGNNHGEGFGMGRKGGGKGRCCDNNFGGKGRGYRNNFNSIEEKEKFLLDELENIRKIKNNNNND